MAGSRAKILSWRSLRDWCPVCCQCGAMPSWHRRIIMQSLYLMMHSGTSSQWRPACSSCIRPMSTPLSLCDLSIKLRERRQFHSVSSETFGLYLRGNLQYLIGTTKEIWKSVSICLSYGQEDISMVPYFMQPCKNKIIESYQPTNTKKLLILGKFVWFTLVDHGNQHMASDSKG